jgi:hypothetical protein
LRGFERNGDISTIIGKSGTFRRFETLHVCDCNGPAPEGERVRP